MPWSSNSYGFGTRRLSNNSQNRRPGGSFADFAYGLDTDERHLYAQDTDAAFEEWLRYLRPGNTQRRQLAETYNHLLNRYNSQHVIQDGGANPYDSFLQYLSGVNPERELRRTSSNMRNAPTRQFAQPARWVAF